MTEHSIRLVFLSIRNTRAGPNTFVWENELRYEDILAALYAGSSGNEKNSQIRAKYNLVPNRNNVGNPISLAINSRTGRPRD